MPVGHLAIPKLDKPQYYFKEGEKADLKVIKMDVENRRIVLSIAERLKDFDEDATQAFIDAHPRLEDVVHPDDRRALDERTDRPRPLALRERSDRAGDHHVVVDRQRLADVRAVNPSLLNRRWRVVGR